MRMYSGMIIISEMVLYKRVGGQTDQIRSNADRYEQWLGVPSRRTLWHGQLGDLDVHLVFGVGMISGMITASLTTATCTRIVPCLVHP